MRWVTVQLRSFHTVDKLQAAAHMGLPTSTSEPVDELPKRFSDDILRIELAGPEHHHLSVVDVPGLFHSKFRHV